MRGTEIPLYQQQTATLRVTSRDDPSATVTFNVNVKSNINDDEAFTVHRSAVDALESDGDVGQQYPVQLFPEWYDLFLVPDSVMIGPLGQQLQDLGGAIVESSIGALRSVVRESLRPVVRELQEAVRDLAGGVAIENQLNAVAGDVAINTDSGHLDAQGVLRSGQVTTLIERDTGTMVAIITDRVIEQGQQRDIAFYFSGQVREDSPPRADLDPQRNALPN